MTIPASPRRVPWAGPVAACAAAVLLAGLVPAGAASAVEPTPAATPAAAAARPVLPAPRLVGPLGSDAPQAVLKEVVVAWQSVAGAAGYRVQVSQDGDFTGEGTLDLTTVATRLALPVGLPNAAYRWRVSALQKTGHGFWSVAGAFTKGWREQVTGLRSSGEDEFPTFAWDPVVGASEYELQISPDPSFSVDPTRAQAGYGTTSCFTTRTRVTGANSQGVVRNDAAGACDVSTLAPGELFHWRVRALDHVVEDLDQVDTAPVNAEGISYQPLAPAAGALDPGACPKPAGEGAAGEPTTAPRPSGEPGPAEPGAEPSAEPGTEPSAAPTPSASASAATATSDCVPAHTVQKSSWSAVVPVTWTPAPSSAPDAGTFAPVPLLPPDPAHCTVVSDLPGEGRRADCVEFPTLDWQARPGATGYRLYVALDDAFTNIQHVVETPGTEWTPTTAWRDTTAAQSYYYAVQACTRARCGLVTSAPDSLRKKSPRTVLTSPAAGAVLGADDVVLRWQPFSTTLRDVLAARSAGAPATAEAHAYRVQVAEAPDAGRPATDADFQTPVLTETVDGTLCRPDAVVATSTVQPRTTSRAVRSCSAAGGEVVADPTRDEVAHVSALVDLPTGSYVWRVQTVDAGGRGLPWSAPAAFRRDTAAPTVAVTGLARAAVDSPFVVRFSEPVVGLTAGSVSVTPGASRVEVAADRRSVTVRPVGTWLPGQAYQLRVVDGLTDDAGNPVAPLVTTATASPRVDDGSPALRYGGSWARRTASNAVGGGFRTTTPTLRKQTTASVTLVGRGVLVTGCVGPAGGMMDVWVDGTKRARVDTYRAYSGCGVRLSRLALAPGGHRVQVRAVGLKRPASRGTTVSLDAIDAL